MTSVIVIVGKDNQNCISLNKLIKTSKKLLNCIQTRSSINDDKE